MTLRGSCAIQACGPIAEVLVDRAPQLPPAADGRLHYQMAGMETMSTAVVRFRFTSCRKDLLHPMTCCLSFSIVCPVFRRSPQHTQLLLTNPNPAAVSRFRLGLIPAEGEFQGCGSSGCVLRTSTMGTHQCLVFLCFPTAACLFCQCGATPKVTLFTRPKRAVDRTVQHPQHATVISTFFVFKAVASGEP